MLQILLRLFEAVFDLVVLEGGHSARGHGRDSWGGGGGGHRHPLNISGPWGRGECDLINKQTNTNQR